jgi:hypothetical protein
MTRLTADLFPRRGRHPNRKTSEYSAFRANPAPAGPTESITLCDGRHGTTSGRNSVSVHGPHGPQCR